MRRNGKDWVTKTSDRLLGRGGEISATVEVWRDAQGDSFSRRMATKNTKMHKKR
jgi:hypothetical protein